MKSPDQTSMERGGDDTSNSPQQQPAAATLSSIIVDNDPQPKDFESLGRMHSEAFAMKNPMCCQWICPNALLEENTKTSIKVHETYLKESPNKLKHCGFVRDDESGEIIGALQLQLKGDPKDGHLGEMANSFDLPGEAHVEWIATTPASQGKGIGSTLLQWADDYSKSQGATFISLEVLGGNKRARALYERKGYEVKPDPHLANKDVYDRCCEKFWTPLCLFCCMGCRYCTSNYMEKSLH